MTPPHKEPTQAELDLGAAEKCRREAQTTADVDGRFITSRDVKDAFLAGIQHERAKRVLSVPEQKIMKHAMKHYHEGDFGKMESLVSDMFELIRRLTANENGESK